MSIVDILMCIVQRDDKSQSTYHLSGIVYTRTNRGLVLTPKAKSVFTFRVIEEQIYIKST